MTLQPDSKKSQPELAGLYSNVSSLFVAGQRARQRRRTRNMPENAHSVQPKSSRADWFVLALLAVSLSGNVILGLSVLRMAGAVPPAAHARASGPAVGTTLPPFVAESPNGRRETIAFGSDPRPTLIYVFTPDCTWCARNRDNVKAVMSVAEKSHRVIAVSLNPEVTDYVKNGQLRARVYVNPSADMFRAYALGPTPLTIVVSPQGRVMKSWIGAYRGALRKEVEAYFNVRLPGVLKEVARADESASMSDSK